MWNKIQATNKKYNITCRVVYDIKYIKIESNDNSLQNSIKTILSESNIINTDFRIFFYVPMYMYISLSNIHIYLNYIYIIYMCVYICVCIFKFI